MTETEKFKFTVVCFGDKMKRRHFTNQTEAVAYANDLLAQNYKVKIYPYSRGWSYIDIIARRGPNG